jgi:NHL repeat
VLSGGNYGFYEPGSIVPDGDHIWVGSGAGNVGSAVTELSASDGSWVTTLSGAQDGFKGARGFAVDGTRIWVLSGEGGGAVRELNVASDPTWVLTLSGGGFGFNNPQDIAVDGDHIWVTNFNSNSVTELTTG